MRRRRPAGLYSSLRDSPLARSRVVVNGGGSTQRRRPKRAEVQCRALFFKPRGGIRGAPQIAKRSPPCRRDASCAGRR